MAGTWHPERPFSPTETRGAEIVWLLELEWASRTWRWASRAMSITGSDGTVYVYDAGLDVEFEQVADFFGSEPGNPSVSITDLQFRGVDVAELIEQGHPLEHAAAELSQWVSGRTYEQRQVRLRGYATAPGYGAEGEPVALSIEPPGLRDRRLVPPPEARVTTETWPNAAEEEIGAYYPRVYGRPGRPDVAVTGVNCGTPAYYVDTSGVGSPPANAKILVADGWTYGTSGTTPIRIINRTALDADTFVITHGYDALGREVTYADVSGPSGLTVNPGDEYWARWDTEFACLGGIPTEKRDGPMEGAGDILVDLLRLSSAGVDYPRWAALRDRLNAYKLALYLDDPSSPWTVITSMVLPLLPVALVHGPDGVYPVLWRADVPASDVIAAIDAGLGLERDGPVQSERDRLANEIRVEYAPRSDNGEPSATVTLTGRDVGGDSEDVYPALASRISRARYDEQQAPAVVTPAVEERATAVRIASWMAAAYALPWRVVSYRDLLTAWACLRVGDTVTLTDAEIHWSAVTCWVVGERWKNGVLSLTFLRVENPARDARA